MTSKFDEIKMFRNPELLCSSEMCPYKRITYLHFFYFSFFSEIPAND